MQTSRGHINVGNNSACVKLTLVEIKEHAHINIHYQNISTVTALKEY